MPSESLTLKYQIDDEKDSIKQRKIGIAQIERPGTHGESILFPIQNGRRLGFAGIHLQRNPREEGGAIQALSRMESITFTRGAFPGCYISHVVTSGTLGSAANRRVGYVVRR
jgi:hypothetical protein